MAIYKIQERGLLLYVKVWTNKLKISEIHSKAKILGL